MNYALLVGINKYAHLNTSRLKGPENDVRLMQHYLEHESPSSFLCKTLTGRAATRKGVMEAFRSHLSQASQGEIALFYFSGHGTKRKSPPEFLTDQEDAYHENLMCYDTRRGDYELADKELKLLVRELTELPHAPQLVLILDCCHSGSATRMQGISELQARSAPINVNERGIDTFEPRAIQKENLRDIPPHILLSACGPREKALESPILSYQEGEEQRVTQGLFTHFLVQTLRQEKSLITYANLVDTIRLKVHNTVPSENSYNPRLEVYGNLGTNLHFLNHDLADEEDKAFLVFHPDWQTWVINKGIAQGIKAGSTSLYEIHYTTQREVIRFDIPTTTIGLAASPVDISRVAPEIFLIEGEAYPAHAKVLHRERLAIVDRQEVLIKEKESLPSSKNGSDAGSVAREGSKKWFYSQESFDANFKLTNEGGNYEIISSNTAYQIVYAQTNKSLLPTHIPRQINAQPSLLPLAGILDQIGQWERAANLKNRTHSKPDHIQVYFQERRTQADHQQAYITLDYDPDLEVSRNYFNLRILQSGRQKLYFQIFYLSRYFQVLPIGVDLYLTPEQGALTLFAKDKSLSIKPNHQDIRPFQVFDMIKLIGSTSSMPYLHLGKSDKLEKTLNNWLSSYRQEEGAALLDSDTRVPTAQHWFTHTFHIKSLLTVGSIGEEKVSIAGTGISIESHPEFRAKIGLSSSARHLWVSEADQYVRLCAQYLGLEVYQIEPEDGITQIELFQIERESSLEQIPLKVKLKKSFSEDLIPWAITLPPELEEDPERPGLFQEIGIWKKEQEGLYTLFLNQILPNPHDGRARSGSSLKISTLLVPKEKVASFKRCFL